MKVRYNRGALDDLDQILSYISERNPRAASQLLSKFEAAANRLSQMPEIGVRTDRSEMRKIVVGNYLMVYELTNAEVVVHFIRHGARKNPWQIERPNKPQL